MNTAEASVQERPKDASAGQGPEARFRALVAEHGAAIGRLARGYEADEGRQQDLVQEILVAIWSALPRFEGRSSLRTWLYRIAHNVAVSHALKGRRDRLVRAVPIDDFDDEGLIEAVRSATREVEGRDAIQRLAALVRALRPVDAQVILLYLEGLEHAEISEVTGLSRDNIAVKIHRIKTALAAAMKDEGVRR
jgi:RNA polymerase sigma-70 factor (ECF subfamily)